MRLPEAVPDLSERGYRIYRRVWLILFAIALVGVAGVIKNNRENYRQNLTIYAYGLKSVPTLDKGLLVSRLTDHPDLAAVPERARVLAIDGSPFQQVNGQSQVENRLQSVAFADRLVAAKGRPIRLRLQAGTKAPVEVTLRQNDAYLERFDSESGVTFATRQIVRNVQSGVGLLVELILPILLFWRRARGAVPALMSFAFLLLVGLNTLHFLSPETQVLWGNRVGALGSTLLLAALLLFPNGSLRPWWTWLGLALIAALFVLRVRDAQLPPAPLLALNIACALTIIGAVLWRYRRVDGAARQQVKWAILGLAFTLLAATIWEIAKFVLASSASGSVGVLLFMSLTAIVGQLALGVTMALSLLRYRLYDADAAIGNSAMVAGMTASLLLLFAVGEKIIEQFGQNIFGNDLGAGPGILAAALAALSVGPLHKRISTWAERRFQGKIVRLREEVPPLVGDLRETETPQRIASIALARMSSAVSDAPMAIHAAGDVLAATGGEVAEAATIIPLTADGVDRDFQLRVGRRPDGTRIGKDETEALEYVSDPLGRALAIALRRAEDRRHRDEANAALERRLAMLESTIARLKPA